MLNISIAEGLKYPGRIYEAELEYMPLELDICRRPIKPVSPIKIKLSYSYEGEGYVKVWGKISGTFKEQCARCGELFDMPLECEFDEQYQRGTEAYSQSYVSDSRVVTDSSGECVIDNPEVDLHIYEGDKIDLAPMINEELLFCYPMAALCRPNCKGLCTECGCNLNYSDCKCSKGIEFECDNLDSMSEAEALDRALEALKNKYNN